MQKNINPVDKNSPEYLTAQVNGARYALLLVIVFTLVNLVLLVTNSDRYFLFAAAIPYYLTMIATVLDGVSFGGSYQITALVISAVILVVYLLCWLLSKKNNHWLITSLVLFIGDTLGLLAVCFLILGEPLSGILDYLIHAWVLYQLIQGVRCSGKLKTARTLGDIPVEGR